MSYEDDECKHELLRGTCSLCSAGPVLGTGRARHAGGSSSTLDSPAALEQYRSRYPGERESTFDAYVEVFFRLSGARSFPGGWTNFSRCANAEPSLVRNEPGLVSRAEDRMRAAGYEADDSGRPSAGRRWMKRA